MMGLGTSEWIGLGMFVVFLGVGMVVVLVQVLATRARVAAFAERGWTYQEHPRGYEVSGGTVVPWTLEVKGGRSSTTSGTSFGTTWTAPAEPTDDAVLVGPKLDLPAAMAVLGGGMVQFLLRMVLGDRASELVGADEVAVGSDTFRARFTVISTSQEAAEALLTDDVQARLLASNLEQLVVLRWRDELQLRCRQGLWTGEQVDGLVGLGEGVAEACGY